MEMQDPALLQIMTTQTNILEEIKNLRARDEMRTQISSVTQNINQTSNPITPHSQIDMFQPNQYYDTSLTSSGVPALVTTANNPMPVSNNMQPINPTQYSTVSNMQSKLTTIPQGITGVTTEAIDDIVHFDSSRMSKQAQIDYIAERSQGFQMGAVNAVSASGQILGGAATLLGGGLLPSLAVGAVVGGGIAYAGNAMVAGARNSLAYQDILRTDGYKAFNVFESTSEFGGIGMSLDDQQDIAGFLRDLAVDEFLEDDEMAKILQGSLDNKLLKSVSDVKSFKDKFKKLVDGVKEISITLDQTLEEAVNFMGELERRGIATENMTQIAAYTKVGASMVGMDAADFANMALQRSDSITEGTTLNATEVVEGISSNAFLVESIAEASKNQDGTLYQFIKNNGGAAQVAGDVEATLRNSVQNDADIQQRLLALFAPAITKNEQGSFQLDESRLNDILGSGKDLRTLLNESTSYTNSLSATELATLTGNVGSIVNNGTNQYQLMSILNRIQDLYQENYDMDPATALTQMGLTNDYNMANLIDQMLTTGTNEDVRRQIDSKALKELMDAGNIVDSPGLGKTISFKFKQLFTNPLEDVGAGISDLVGDFSQETQMWIKGIEETGIVGGDLVPAFTEENMEDFFYDNDSLVNRNVELIKNFESYGEMFGPVSGRIDDPTGAKALSKMGNKGVVEVDDSNILETISNDQFNMMIDAAKKGEMSTSQLRELQEKIDSGNLHASTVQQYQYILNTATGEYDGGGFFTKMKQAADYTESLMHWGSLRDTGEENGVGSSLNSLELIEEEEKILKKEGGSLQKELNKTLLNSSINSDDLDAVRAAIESGDIESVQTLTSDNSVLEIARRYSDYLGKAKNLSEVKDNYFDIQNNALALGKSTEGVYNFLAGSGIFTDEEFDSYFGDAREDVRDIIEDMPKMDNQEIADASMQLLRENKTIFQTLSSSKQQEVAEALVQYGSVDDISAFYKEGTQVIDSEKLFNSLMETGRYQQSGENAAVSVLENGEINTALDEHKNALENVMSTFVAETEIINQAISDLQTAKRSYTTTTR